MVNSIKSGQPWFDDKGSRIQAHAGALYYENDILYWYGENKEPTDGKSKIWTSGLIIKPAITNKRAILHPSRRNDRPHILFNEKTGKYVCWLKECCKRQRFHILTADNLLGPYQIVNGNFFPLGKDLTDEWRIEDYED